MTVEDTRPLPGGPPLGENALTWAPGAMAGRFVILGTLGTGGMGMVFSAYDPVLDRKVALKTLRTGLGYEPGAHLVREAQAMARVQHPNVCAVHDIGTVDGQLFVAMELVEGDTLRPWMKERRPWREVLRMFIAAGRGLEAAHAAGLVHRDFKPENVLVGRDGRPRVTDFGLVSLRALRSLDLPAPTSPAGTPGYMAPEQMRNEPADTRSDQFSFCVALWEALEGERPFPSSASPEQRRPPEETPARIPQRLALVLARGMAQRPDHRWPSMGALLGALTHEPARARLRLIGASALVVLAALSVTGAKLGRKSNSCSGAEKRLAGIWDQTTQQRLAAAFGDGESWRRTRAIVDRYAQAWTGIHEEACRATRVEGRQSDTLLDLRMACLERRRSTLAALTGLWTDKLKVEHAATAAAALEPLDDCSDARALSTAATLPLPQDPNARRKIVEVRAGLDRARALAANSNWGAAREAAAALQRDADATGYAPLGAEAKMLLGTALERMGDPSAAPTLEEAARLAAVAHDDPLAARAMMLLVQVLSNDAARFERAIALLPAAEAFVARAGDPPQLRGRLLAVRAQVLLDSGNAAKAKELLLEGVPLLSRSLGENAAETLAAQSVLAGTANAMGDHDTARGTLERLLVIETQLDGLNSPEYARGLTNLAMVETDAGHHARARELFQRALDIREHYLGSNNTEVAQLHIGIANLDFYAEHYDDAALRYEKAIAIMERVLSPDHAYLAVCYGNLGAARRGQGRLDEALTLGKKSVDLSRKAYGNKHPQLAMMESEYAATLRRRGRFAVARTVAEEARVIFVAAKSAPEQLGAIDFELAQDQWGGGDHPKALATAAAAETALRDAGDAGKLDAAKLRTWLKERR